MKASLRKMVAVVSIILIGTILAAKANAECVSLASPKALQPQSWQGNELFRQGSWLLVSDHDDPIVGMWQVRFTAEGNTGSGAPPDGTPIDNAFVQWHSDGTEIMNSGRPPQDGELLPGSVEKNRTVVLPAQPLCFGVRYIERAERDREPGRGHSDPRKCSSEPGGKQLHGVVYPGCIRHIRRQRCAYHWQDQRNPDNRKHICQRCDVRF